MQAASASATIAAAVASASSASAEGVTIKAVPVNIAVLVCAVSSVTTFFGREIGIITATCAAVSSIHIHVSRAASASAAASSVPSTEPSGGRSKTGCATFTIVVTGTIRTIAACAATAPFAAWGNVYHIDANGYLDQPLG